ncbi:hypothetical protein BH11BAC3_BH11BAC3_14140 [soil metagenome]
MLDSFLTDFSLIRDTLEQEGDHNFFGKNFSFFSADPILFYNNEKDVIVYANSMFTSEFNYTVEDLAEWKYSFYPLLNKEDQEPFKAAMSLLLGAEDIAKVSSDGVYRLIGKGKKYSYYRLRVRKLHKSYYYIQLENASKSAIPVLKNSTADQLMQDAESILKFGFWMSDAKVDKLYWTRGMYHLLEYDTEEEIETVELTRDFYESHILKSDAWLRLEEGIKEGLIKDFYTIKYQLKTKKDNLLTVSEYAKIDYDDDGNIKMIMGLIRDITLQEDSMKSLVDYKAMMLENEKFLNYGTWEGDEAGNIKFWTDGMYNIFGYDHSDKKELVNINQELLKKHMMPDDFQSSLAFDAERLKTVDHYHLDYQIKDNKEVTKILSSYAKIIRNNDNQIQKIIGVTRDVTELRNHERNLEEKIFELNRSNRELEEFAYVASHDLQEPLRKISTFSQRLQLKFGDKLGEDGNLYISRMVNACDNMRKLIDNLLEFSRISLNNPPPMPIDLSVIMKQVQEELDLHISETNSTITIGTLPSIEAINSQMLQLFSNIVNNSIKFRKATVPLQINITSSKLNSKEKETYQLDKNAEYFIIKIKDNGIGFEPQYADKIFHLFQRLQGKSEYPGTGIGLSICKKIVSNHKGLIFAESEYEQGAEFSIILPQQQ